MKNEFDMFNNMEMDFSEYEDIPFDSEEKNKLISSLEPKLNNRYKLNKNIITAAIALIVICSFTLTNDAVLASINNASKSIKEHFSPQLENALDENTIPIGQTVYDKGIGVTLNEVFIDGNQIIVSTSIDFSNYKFKRRNDELYNYTIDCGINTSINGKPTVGAGWGSYELLNDTTLLAISSRDVSDLNLDDDSDTIDISVDFSHMVASEIEKDTLLQNKFKRIRGNWDFNFKVDKDKVVNSTKTITPEANSFNINNNIFEITKVSLSPISLKIYHSPTSMDNKKVPSSMFKVIDEFGTELDPRGSSSDFNYVGHSEFILPVGSSKFEIIPIVNNPLSESKSITVDFN